MIARSFHVWAHRLSVAARQRQLGMNISQYIYNSMKSNHSISYILATVVMLSLTVQIRSFVLCSNNCTATTPNAFCTSQGYCSCTPGFIFSCNTPATTANSNAFLTPLTASRPYYYILSSQIGVELEYTVTFYDATNPNILATYQPDFYTDMGMNVPPANTYTVTSYSNKPNTFSCTFTITLSNQPGTELPQNLILMVNISSPTIIPSLVFSYSYTTLTQGTPVFLILGYVAGGLLILISIILIVVVYRRKSTNRRRRDSTKAEPKVFDITHFEQFMPAHMISVQDKRNLQTCSVCLQQFDFNSTIRKTICQHAFHTSCIDEWCIKNLSCPMCRTDLNRDSLNQQRSQRTKRESQTDWIMNSLAGDEEPSEIRHPLNNSATIDNNDL